MGTYDLYLFEIVLCFIENSVVPPPFTELFSDLRAVRREDFDD